MSLSDALWKVSSLPKSSFVDLLQRRRLYEAYQTFDAISHYGQPRRAGRTCPSREGSCGDARRFLEGQVVSAVNGEAENTAPKDNVSPNVQMIIIIMTNHFAYAERIANARAHAERRAEPYTHAERTMILSF